MSKPYQSFMICTAPRSGSTLLCSLLAATKMAGNPDSHFHSLSLDDWMNDYSLHHSDYASKEEALQDIFKAALKRGKGETDVFGLRMQRSSFDHFMEQLTLLLPGLMSDAKRIEKAFGPMSITVELIGKAIASFQRTLLSGNSAYDQFGFGKNEAALSSNAQNGFRVFVGKGQCLRCHFGFNFTDERFHNLGVDWDTDHIDVGRYGVTKTLKDLGAFKTPTLREIARTAPYMHDGRFATLRQVVDFYDRGGIPNPHLDTVIKPLHLTEQEKDDLVEFLHSLNGEGWEVIQPSHFPE